MTVLSSSTQHQDEPIPHVRQDLILRAMMREMERQASSPQPRRRSRRDGSRRHLNALSDESVNTAPTVNSTPIRLPSQKKDTTIELGDFSLRSLQSLRKPTDIEVEQRVAPNLSPGHSRRTKYHGNKHLEVPAMETEGCPEDVTNVLSPTARRGVNARQAMLQTSPRTETRRTFPSDTDAPESPRSPIETQMPTRRNSKNGKVFKDIKPILDHDRAQRMSHQGIPSTMRKAKCDDMRLKRTRSEARLITPAKLPVGPGKVRKPQRSNSLPPPTQDGGRNPRRNVVKQLLPTGQLIEPRRLPLCTAYDDDFNDNWASASCGTLGSFASGALVDDGFGTISRNETFLRRQKSAPSAVTRTTDAS